MRRLLLVWGALGLVIAGCAGFKPVERGNWRRVYAPEVTRRSATSKQEIITRDTWEREVAAGSPRTWEPPPGYLAPYLHKSPTLGLAVGEVLELRIDEARTAALELNGSAVELFWNPQVKVDGWKNGIDVTKRESVVWLVGREPGTATLRFTSGGTPTDIPVTVTR